MPLRPVIGTLTGCAVALGLVAAASKSAAQPVPLPPPAAFAGSAGWTIGDFALAGEIDAGIEATSNIRVDPSEESDFEYSLLAAGVLRSTWSRHALALTGSYARQQAVETDDQLSEAISASVSGRYDASDAWSATLGLKQDESIVGRDNPLQFIGNLNGTTSIRTLEGSLDWTGAETYASLYARYYTVENTTEIDVTEVSRLQAQDTDEFDATLEAGRSFDWGKAYIFAGVTDITYTGSENVLPFNRDSFGVRMGVGMEGQFGKLTAQARLIAFAQDFENGDIGNNASLVGLGALLYQATDRLSLGILAQRQFDDINILPTSAGLFTNAAAAAIQFAIRDDLYVKAGPSVNYYQIEDTELEALSWSGDASLAWQFHPRARLTLAGSVFTQDANDEVQLGSVIYDEQNLKLTGTFTF